MARTINKDTVSEQPTNRSYCVNEPATADVSVFGKIRAVGRGMLRGDAMCEDLTLNVTLKWSNDPDAPNADFVLVDDDEGNPIENIIVSAGEVFDLSDYKTLVTHNAYLMEISAPGANGSQVINSSLLAE